MKSIVNTSLAPAAIGPYSQAVRAGDFLFCSGQIPIDVATGAIVVGGIREQTKCVMDNLRAVLEAGGASLSCVVKATIFLVDLGDFGAVNDVYGSYFPSEPPARACVQVSKLPRDSRVEIEAVAYIGV